MYNCKEYNQTNTSEYLLKICAIGSGNTGKTLFIRKFAEGKFDTNYLPTLGVDITTKKICFNNTQIKLILVDTAGQEFFGKLRPSYYRGASAGLIFCNIYDRNSIETIPNWLTEFRKFFSPQAAIPMGIVVIKDWKFSHRRGKLRKKQQISTIRDQKGKYSMDYQIIHPICDQIMKKLRTIFRRKRRNISSEMKSPKRKLRKRSIPTALSHLTNNQLIEYYAEFYQLNLFEIKLDDCRAIEECFVSMARQVIKGN
ncbi:MAG: Rab family GTPase [Candidatus Hodarchaeales archaeon]